MPWSSQEKRKVYYARNAEKIKAKTKRNTALRMAADPEQERQKRRDSKARGRLLGLPGFKLVNFDEHVKVWRTWKLAKPKPSSRPHSAHVSQWRKANPAAAWRHAYRTDPQFNAREKARARLREINVNDLELGKRMTFEFKRGRWRDSWRDALGYGQSELWRHLVTTLPRGWRLEHFISGDLQIDHIKPRSSFDLRVREQVIECWQLSNLRLIPAAENVRKGSADPCTFS